MTKLDAIRKIMDADVPDYVKKAGIRQVLDDNESCADLIAERYSTSSAVLAKEASKRPRR